MNKTKESKPRTYAKSPYTVSEDGHFVGEDGYIVPKNFTEFYERYPDQVRKFIRSRRWFRLNYGDRMNEVSQALIVHLMTLPPTSIYRERGMHDRIEAFNPDSAHGATEGRFLYYIHRTLQNCFVDIIRTALKDPIDNGYPLGFEMDWVTDEPEWLAENMAIRDGREAEEAADRVDTLRFEEFVKSHNPELVPVLKYLIDNPSAIDCRTYMNLSKQLFSRARRRLAYLYERWEKGSKHIARQRRVYPPRKKKEAIEVNQVESSYSPSEVFA